MSLENSPKPENRLVDYPKNIISYTGTEGGNETIDQAYEAVAQKLETLKLALSTGKTAIHKKMDTVVATSETNDSFAVSTVVGIKISGAKNDLSSFIDQTVRNITNAQKTIRSGNPSQAEGILSQSNIEVTVAFTESIANIRESADSAGLSDPTKMAMSSLADLVATQKPTIERSFATQLDAVQKLTV